MLSFLFSDAHAGVLKGPHEYAKPQHFFDWRYAQKVWFELNTWEKSEAEWNKYASDFDPWLKMYKENQRKALDALDTYSETKRKNIQRGYDLQLAYDQWFDEVYSSWYNGYAYEAVQAPIHKRTARTFDDVLASFGQRASCIPTHYLNECGPVPDWRSEKWLANEQAMMQKAKEEVAARGRNRK